jgi:hypothetical protein
VKWEPEMEIPRTDCWEGRSPVIWIVAVVPMGG